MKKKLLILGDSFAVAYGENIKYGWVEKLKEHFDVHSTAVSGSGVYWSYLKFLQYYKDYDYIIWCVSDALRGWIRDVEDKVPAPYLEHYNPNYVNGRWKHWHRESKLSLPSEVKFVYKKLDDYYALLDEKKENLSAYLMVEDAKRKRPDMLAISCFGRLIGSWFPESHKVFANETRLVRIQFMEEDYWVSQGQISRQDIDQMLGHYDTRVCHFSNENNLMMYNKIMNWIDTKEFTLTEQDWVEPKDSWRKYLKHEI